MCLCLCGLSLVQGRARVRALKHGEESVSSVRDEARPDTETGYCSFRINFSSHYPHFKLHSRITFLWELIFKQCGQKCIEINCRQRKPERKLNSVGSENLDVF